MGGLRDYYLDWPFEISIETFAKCNASCTFCPYPTLERIGTKLPDETIDRMIEELKDHPHPFIIAPFKVNEPLLDKRLLPLCRKINAALPNAHLRIFSNGSALTLRHIEEIGALQRVKHFWCSLNEHRAAEYKAVMGLAFERTCSNLDNLHAAKSAGAFEHEVVLSKVRKTLALDADDVAFAEFCKARWPLFLVHIIKPDGWLGEIPLGSDEIPDTPCSRWFELSITATGVVSHCCMDGKAEYPIGDVTKQSLFEIYNSPGWRENRLKLWGRSNVHPCSTCSY